MTNWFRCTECRTRRIKCSGSIPCELCKRKLRQCCVAQSRKSVEDPGFALADLKKYNCKLERYLLAKCPNLTLKDLRANIDQLEKSVATKETLEMPEDNVVAQLPKNMASTSDQSFISFINSEGSRESEFKHVVTFVPLELLLEPLALLPPIERMRKFIDVFLGVCETNFFYTHPRKIYCQMELLYDNMKDLLYLSCHWVVLMQLMGILSIATNYEYILDNAEKPLASAGPPWEDPGYSYFLLMLPFVGYLIHNNNLDSIQIFQLMGVYMTTKRVDTLSLCIDQGYRYMSLALEIAITNKFHLRETHELLPTSDSQFITRIWWSCYCLERRLGFNLEKPDPLEPKDITVALPESDSSLFHLDGTSNWANERSLIEVIKIFGNISAFVYSNKESSISISSKTVRDISMQLDVWRDLVLEQRRRMEQSTEPGQCKSPRANKHLDLFYYLGKIYLGKPFLLYQVENHQSFKKQPKTAQSSFIHYMTSICIDAAYNIFDVLTEMKNRNELAIYSSTDLNFCNIGLFVTIAFLKIDSSPSTQLFLRRGLDILKELSKGSSSAKVNVSMFSKFEQALDLLSSKEKNSPTGFGTSPGLFPDWDVDIYTSDIQFGNMSSLPLFNNATNGQSGEALSHNFHDEFLASFGFH